MGIEKTALGQLKKDHNLGHKVTDLKEQEKSDNDLGRLVRFARTGVMDERDMNHVDSLLKEMGMESCGSFTVFHHLAYDNRTAQQNQHFSHRHANASLSTEHACSHHEGVFVDHQRAAGVLRTFACSPVSPASRRCVHDCVGCIQVSSEIFVSREVADCVRVPLNMRTCARVCTCTRATVY